MNNKIQFSCSDMFVRFNSEILAVLLSVLTINLTSCDNRGGGSNSSDLFTHGIASGDVRDNEAILWTRVNQEAELVAEVSTDCEFKTIERGVKAKALAENDFTVKVRITGLDPDQLYCYRFKGKTTSELGTFRTAPGDEQNIPVIFAYSSDSDGSREPPFNNFEVFKQAMLDEIDFWIYLGDTVYMDTFGPVAKSLDEMRDKYKQNREFIFLRDLLKSIPTFVVWDDHEVENDYDGETVDMELYENGRKAFFEYMPVAETEFLNDPLCAGDPIFRVFHWGKTLDLIILDERSCRSASVEERCEDDLIPTLRAEIRQSFGLAPEPPPGCLEDISNPDRTMLGGVQKEAFKRFILESRAVWKMVINEVPMSEFFAIPYDRWEGYSAEREELLNFITESNINNIVFLTGDLHINFAGDVRFNAFNMPEPIAKEIIAGPIAQNTFFGMLAEEVGSEAIASAIINDFASITNPMCLQGDSFGYALVEADSDSFQIMLKNQDGLVLRDQITGAPCSFSIEAQ